MAEDTKKVVLKYEADVASLIKGAQSVETISNRMLKTLGQQGLKVQKVLGGAGTSVKKTADIFDKATGKLKSMGSETTKVATRIKLANGVVGTYTETVKRMTDGTKKVTGAFKQANTATGSFVSRLGVLAKRAIGVVLVWSTLRAGMQSLNRLFKSSIKFIIDWEFQMAQVAIVGGTTTDQISLLSGALIQVGKDFGISFKDLGEASKLWRQQGRAMEEIIPLMRTTAKLSLLTGQTTTESVENLTAVLKAYRIEAKDSITIIDSMTNVMLKHAITAGDLSSAYKQVASTASSLGVSFEELTGFITAIKAVTRDSGSKIGLSLRTMFSRITTSSKESIQNLASIPLHLDSLGRSTFSVTPRMRNLGDIISELSLKFGSLGNAQKSQLATLIGGVRRQNQVFALFDNFTESIEAQTDAIFGLGKSSDAINILTNTAKIGIDKLKNSWFSFIESVADSSVIKGVVNGLASAVNALDKALAPKKAQFKERLDVLNDENDELSRQLKFLEGITQITRQIGELDEQSTRASKEQRKILDESANQRREALNEAIKLAGFQFKISETGGLSGFSNELAKIQAQVQSSKIETLLGQELIALNTEALSAGQSISALIEKFAVGIGPIANFYRPLLETAKTFREKGIVPQDEIAKVIKLVQQFGILNKEEAGLLKNITEKYTDINEKLSDRGKLEENIIKKLKNQQQHAKDIVLNYKKQQIISKAVIDDQLERLKNAGALNSEILKAKQLLNDQFNVQQSLNDRVRTQLALEREKTKEQRLQGKLGSDSIKLFTIAKTEGVDVAKKIGDVLSGAIDFTEFIRRGGKAVEVFQREFAGKFEQQQAEQFFRGDRVSGEKRLRGGTRIDIQEEGIRQTLEQRLAEAKKVERDLFRQEQLLITPQKIIQAPVDVKIETNINVNDAKEISDKVISEVARQLPQVGSEVNKALAKANFGKQANNN